MERKRKEVDQGRSKSQLASSSRSINSQAPRAAVKMEQDGSRTSKASYYDTDEIMKKARFGEAPKAFMKMEKDGSSTSKATAGPLSFEEFMEKAKRAYVKMAKERASASKARAASHSLYEMMEKPKFGEASKTLCAFCKRCIKSDEMCRNSLCSHSGCIKCISIYVSLQIEAETTSRIMCPAYNCGAVLELSPRILPKPLQERWNAAKYEALDTESAKNHIPLEDRVVLLANNKGEGICRKGEYPWFSHAQCKDKGEVVSRKGEYPWYSHTECKDQGQVVSRNGGHPWFSHTECKDQGEGVSRKGKYPWHSHTRCKDQKGGVSRKGEYPRYFYHIECKDQGEGVSRKREYPRYFHHTECKDQGGVSRKGEYWYFHHTECKDQGEGVSRQGEYPRYFHHTECKDEEGVSRKGEYPWYSHAQCKDQGEVSRKGEYPWSSHKDQLQGLGGYGIQVGEPSQRRVYEICEICCERKERAGMFRNKSCSHSVCTDCISKHIEIKIENNSGVILCPGLDCRGVLTPERCKEFLPKRVLERWEWTIIQSLILDSEKFYCPFKDCSAMLLNDNAEEAMMMRESECPHCRRLFCVQCHVPWHSGMECREFQRLNADERGREDILLRELANEKKWKRCPKCKFYVEKVEGCVHVTCRCRFEFCYRCGGQWSMNHGICQISQ